MGKKPTLCSACKSKEPFFYRNYSGESLCKKCFSESIETKVRVTIIKNKMLKFNDKLAIAVSGGKDSLTLLHVLTKMNKKNPQSTLVAITVDEGIQGYRDEALKIASKTCKKLKIQHHTVSFKQLYGFTLDEIILRIRQKNNKLTPCAFCGVLRRKALNVAAIEVGANKIATGHTLDDEVQTNLLNIFHGDIQKLAVEKPITTPVHPKLVQKIKPLCEIPEKESALYTYTKKIPFQSTPCPYASEAMRNDIRLLLNQIDERHAGTKFTVFKAIERLRPAIKNLTPKNKFKECTNCGDPSSGPICMACQLLKQIQ
jgi:uncharacterized protein (TIGR00269 family)